MKPWHIFWGGLLAVGLIAETVALVNKEKDDTLSDCVWDNPHPMIPFTIGVVVGHWFWQRKPADITTTNGKEVN